MTIKKVTLVFLFVLSEIIFILTKYVLVIIRDVIYSFSNVISDLLINLPHFDITRSNISFSPLDLHPLPNLVDVDIVGNPTIVQSPIGNAIRCTGRDSVVYKFDVVKPWPCPFNISQCRSFTVSLWFWGEEYISNRFQHFFSMGSTWTIYRRPKQDRVNFRWIADNEFTGYNSVENVPQEECVHFSVTWDESQTVTYLNGRKRRVISRRVSSKSAVMDRKLWLSGDDQPGNVSMGAIQIWSGKKSPVFLWRLYQEGRLPKYGRKTGE